MEQGQVGNDGMHGRRRQKVRIRYRERVRLKASPPGHRLKKFLRKHLRKVALGIVLVLALGAGIYWAFVADKELREARRAGWERYQKELINKKKLY
ncbi:MAG: hypothetical protein K9J06_16280 [Flavobacteriales bacterium]|nr:hypothetical protein [Flavobacteriales bacterium]